MKTEEKKWFISHSPINITKESKLMNPLSVVYYTNVKDQKSIGGRIIAKCMGKIPEEVKANAKLIAAAPDLLKFAQNIIKALNPKSIDFENKSVGIMTVSSNKDGIQDKSLDMAIISGIQAIKNATQ